VANTSIEWCDKVWNPVRGCSRVSRGCEHCYAERFAARFSDDGKPFRGFAVSTYGGPRWTGKVALVPEKLEEPLRWRKPRRVFVNSMSDLFHESLSGDAIADVFYIMGDARRHTFQVLTKRPARMRDFVRDLVQQERVEKFSNLWPLRNVWLGVSVEDQKTVDERIPLLLDTPAALRFVSYEPALGPVSFAQALTFNRPEDIHPEDTGGRMLAAMRGIDWLIVGGESGPGARPFDVAWARSVIAECRAAGVPCFVKQMGDKPKTDHRTRPAGEDWSWTSFCGPKGKDPALWPEDLRVREFPS
jgi:protein gp37